MSRFASSTQVSAENSRLEIERTLQRYGASSFCYGNDGNTALIGFRADDRVVRFSLTLPSLAEFGGTPTQATARRAQAIRQRWRCLALVIKAKLEAVESGIVTFEHEFLAHITLSDGRTVGEHVTPRLAEAYKSGKPILLLPGGI